MHSEWCGGLKSPQDRAKDLQDRLNSIQGMKGVRPHDVDKKDYEKWAETGDDGAIHHYMGKDMREISRDGMCTKCKAKNES